MKKLNTVKTEVNRNAAKNESGRIKRRVRNYSKHAGTRQCGEYTLLMTIYRNSYTQHTHCCTLCSVGSRMSTSTRDREAGRRLPRTTTQRPRALVASAVSCRAASGRTRVDYAPHVTCTCAGHATEHGHRRQTWPNPPYIRMITRPTWRSTHLQSIGCAVFLEAFEAPPPPRPPSPRHSCRRRRCRARRESMLPRTPAPWL